MVVGCEYGLGKYYRREEVNWYQGVNIFFWFNAIQYYREGGMLLKK